LSVCLFLWVCVVCVCFLLYMSFSLCCERCVVCVRFCIHNHLSVFFLLSLRIQYVSLVQLSCYTHNPAHMSVLLFYLHVYYSDSCVCVSKGAYTFPCCSIFVHIYHHFYMYCLCYVVYLYPCFVWFLLFLKLNRHLCYGVYWCNHTPTHILILWFLLYFHLAICTSTILRAVCLP